MEVNLSFNKMLHALILFLKINYKSQKTEDGEGVGEGTATFNKVTKFIVSLFFTGLFVIFFRTQSEGEARGAFSSTINTTNTVK